MPSPSATPATTRPSAPERRHLRHLLRATLRIAETTAGNFDCRGRHGGTFTLSGVISGAVGGVSKEGAGTVTLTGLNTYTGATSAGAGTLRAGNNQAFSSSAVTLVNTGSVLEVANGINVGNALAVSDTGDKKTLQLQSGATSGTYSGNIAIAETTAGNFEVGADTAGNLSVSGVISGAVAGGVSKVGAGTVTLAGLNTYTGATAVNAGVLEVNGTTGGTTAAGTSVAAGATLAGTGTISGATATHTISGTVSPGTSGGLDLGALTFEAGSNLTFSSGSSATFTFDNPAGTYDRINGTGTLTWMQASPSRSTGSIGYTPMLADVWTVWIGRPLSPTASMPAPTYAPAVGGGSLDLPDVSGYFLAWNVGNFTTNGSISFVVPEPGRMLLMFFGLAALFLRRRRQGLSPDRSPASFKNPSRFGWTGFLFPLRSRIRALHSCRALGLKHEPMTRVSSFASRHGAGSSRASILSFCTLGQKC